MVVEKKLKREIQILYLLAEQSQSISGNEIAIRLNISLSTVLSDLENLKATIPENWIIEFRKNIGYTLKIDEGINLSNYIKRLFLNSPLFEIGISIFNDLLLSTREWEERLYISDSTLKRHLNVLKSILKEYNLKLSTNPVNIVGNEAAIRIFYFDFFYSSSKIPQFDSLQENELEFFHKLEPLLSFDHLQYYRWMHWVIIVIRRCKFDNKILLNDELLSIIETKIDIKKVDKIKEMFYCFFNKELSFEEVSFLYLIRWDTLILNYSDKIINIEIANEKKRKLLKNLILKKVRELSIDTYIHPYIYSYYEAFFNHIIIMSSISPVFQKNNPEINHFAQITHPGIYQFWIETLVKENKIFKSDSILFYEDLSAQLTMLTYPYLVKKNQKLKYVVFILDTTVINLNYLTSLAERYVANNIQVSVLSNVFVSEELLANIGADLIVSNVEIETSKKIVHISELPTEFEWKMINSIIFNDG